MTIQEIEDFRIEIPWAASSPNIKKSSDSCKESLIEYLKDIEDLFIEQSDVDLETIKSCLIKVGWNVTRIQSASNYRLHIPN